MEPQFYILIGEKASAHLWMHDFFKDFEYKPRSHNIMILSSEVTYKKTELEYALYMLKISHSEKDPFVLFVANAHLIGERNSALWLKPLEELSKHTYVFFHVDNEDGLLDTVRSRAICLLLDKSDDLVDHIFLHACLAPEAFSFVQFEELLNNQEISVFQTRTLLQELLSRLVNRRDMRFIELVNEIEKILRLTLVQACLKNIWRAVFIMCKKDS